MSAEAPPRPRVTINYCVKCHFLPRASWVAQELLHTFAGYIAEVALVPGEGGVFEIAIDGEPVFSTKTHGRFPEMRELRELVRARVEGAPSARHAS